MAFSNDTKQKVLLWSDRHCCLCKKPCGLFVEVHHIVPLSRKGSDDIGNAIPLCLECHGIVESYNTQHSKGNRYKAAELRLRRDQVYEEFTRHLIPPIFYTIPQKSGRVFPDVGFAVTNFGDSLSAEVLVVAKARSGTKWVKIKSPYYSGMRAWRLNPRFTINGHFGYPFKNQSKPCLRFEVTIKDKYEMPHEHLPVQFGYNRKDDCWIVQP